MNLKKKQKLYFNFNTTLKQDFFQLKENKEISQRKLNYIKCYNMYSLFIY